MGTPEYIAPEVYFIYINFNKYVKICLMIKVIKNKLKNEFMILTYNKDSYLTRI